MGLHVSIFRDASGYDCTMNGISGLARGHTTLCLVNVDGPFEPSDKAPPALLLSHAPTGRPGVRIVPAVKDAAGDWVRDPRWVMFGGNYGASSDSRFGEAVTKALGIDIPLRAVPIHDRIEA